jgi:hypothetical protein
LYCTEVVAQEGRDYRWVGALRARDFGSLSPTSMMSDLSSRFRRYRYHRCTDRTVLHLGRVVRPLSYSTNAGHAGAPWRRCVSGRVVRRRNPEKLIPQRFNRLPHKPHARSLWSPKLASNECLYPKQTNSFHPTLRYLLPSLDPEF